MTLLENSETVARSTSSSRRIRISNVLLSVAITIVCFLQNPGRIVDDTKLDIAIAPLTFLKHALHLWDPTQNFGQVPNQAYGYFFPMGPFFIVGHIFRLPTWIIQRSWVSALFIIAFWGIIRLADELKIGNSTSQTLASLAYILSPALTTFGSTSYYILPFAFLPWIVLPLVRGSRSGSVRRAAALSGIAILCIGGANGAAVIAVLPVPMLWLLTRTPGRRRRELTLWWFLSLVCACTWWVIPLILQGRYGFNLLAYTEQPGTTTAVTSLFEVLRSNAVWLSYNHIGITAIQSGWEAVTSRPMIAAGVALTAIGLFGLAHSQLKERVWLVGSFAAGLVLVGAGYSHTTGAPLATVVQRMLAGPLAPLRNVWKFQAIIVMAVSLGIAHAVDVIQKWSSTRRKGDKKLSRIGASGGFVAILLIAVALVGMMTPFFKETFFPGGSFKAVPSYWQTTASWLAKYSGTTTSLVVPGSPTATYLWGYPGDEPLQWLAQSNWAVRSRVPDSSIGNIVTLDAVNAALRDGIRNQGLATYLSQAGVRFLVVRNDLDPRSGPLPSPGSIYETLASSPGFTRATGFGPISHVMVGPKSVSLHAIDIYQVDHHVTTVDAPAIRNSVVVSGGPDALLQMDSSGLGPGSRAVALAGDSQSDPTTSTLVVSDTARRIGTNFGSTEPSQSYVLGRDQRDPVTKEAPLIWTVFPEPQFQTYATYLGVRNVTASSYGASDFYLFPYQMPNAAVDGDPETAWVASSKNNSIGQWIQVQFNRARVVSHFTLRLQETPASPRITQVKVSTQQGSVLRAIPPVDAPFLIDGIPGRTHWLRITFTQAEPPFQQSSADTGAGIEELSIPGVDSSRTLVTPTAGIQRYVAQGTRNPIYLFNAGAPDHSYGDVEPGADQEPHLSRLIVVPKPAVFSVTGTVVARPGEQLNAFLGQLGLRSFSQEPLQIPCGQGPILKIDGRKVPLQVHGTLQQLSNWEPLTFTTCPGNQAVTLSAGKHVVNADDPGYLKILSMTLAPQVSQPLGPPSFSRATSLRSWGPDSRIVAVGPGPRAYLVVKQNFNAGWQAHLGSTMLQPARINGWEQAWILPAGTGGSVVLNFAPDRLYRTGLLAGGILVLFLLFLAVIPRRRHPDAPRLSSVASLPVWLGLLVAGITLFLLGGVLVAILLPLIALAWFDRWRQRLPIIAALAFCAAGIVVVLNPATNPVQQAAQFGVWSQVLCSLAIGSVLVGLATSRWERKRRAHSHQSEPT